MRERGAFVRPENRQDEKRRVKMRELPPLRCAVPHARAENRQEQRHLPHQRAVEQRGHRGDLPPGGDRGDASVLHGEPEALPDLLGQNAAERLAGHESVHRPAARADGDQDLPRQKAGPYRARFRGAYPYRQPAAAAEAGSADPVFGHELRRHQLQRARMPCARRACAGHLLQHR